MNISEHARILSAYLRRLNKKDLDRIIKADAKCWYASQNNGTNEQIKVQNEFDGVILDIMGNMLSHDRENITTIVAKIVNREVTA